MNGKTAFVSRHFQVRVGTATARGMPWRPVWLRSSWLFKKGLLILENTLNFINCWDLDLSRIQFSSLANWFV